jgi:hypothetical protein
MFLECSDKSQVPSFMEHVIDPQPHGNIGGFGKVDFLQVSVRGHPSVSF